MSPAALGDYAAFTLGKTVIRPFRAADREAVRTICCETADAGRPLEPGFFDRELVADLVTRYYTDFEPESAWVTEAGGRVAGYLTGARDTRRFRRVWALRIAPPALARAVARGFLFRRSSWQWIAGLLRCARAQQAAAPPILGAYPAHLHIDLLDEARGRGAGGSLMRTFLEYLAGRGIPGVHARVRADNAPGRAFFERMGFAPVAAVPNFRGGSGGLQHGETIIYGHLIPARA